MHDKIRVMVADDHVMVVDGLVAMIGRQVDMEVVAQASTGADAVHQWRKFRPDISMLDVRMPVMDGVEAIEAIRRENPAARIIMLTTFDTGHDVFRAIKAGARGYLLKDVSRELLLDCIRRVHAGEICIPSELTAKLAATLSEDALTGREAEILRLLASGNSNKEIAASLFISDTTVKSHLRNIFIKLAVDSRTAAIRVARGRGLLSADV